MLYSGRPAYADKENNAFHIKQNSSTSFAPNTSRKTADNGTVSMKRIVSISTPTAAGLLVSMKHPKTGQKMRHTALVEKSNTVQRSETVKGVVQPVPGKRHFGSTTKPSLSNTTNTKGNSIMTGSVSIRALRDVTNQTPGTIERSALKKSKALKLPKTTGKSGLGKGLQIWADDTSSIGTNSGKSSSKKPSAHTPSDIAVQKSIIDNTAYTEPSAEMCSNDDLTVEYMAPSTLTTAYRFMDDLELDTSVLCNAPTFEYVTKSTMDILAQVQQLDLSDPVPSLLKTTKASHPEYDCLVDTNDFNFDSSVLMI
ncbi:hypothetical protein BDV3_004539 [Batrachochytrium dendrobatidis]|uniref:Uncharacterized protein n=2 Tax=Batrachochytrium dendrobatidis (strain JEL423) TaxID=403673 RepID=A0A177WI04_BATDL|nr:hypothetical protein BDEG_23011 [Batrachochytrium dendrobatidis JEL423]